MRNKRFGKVCNWLQILKPFFRLLRYLFFYSAVQKQQEHQKILHEQFQQHNNFLFDLIVLIILAIPYLTITYLSGYMKSTRNP